MCESGVSPRPIYTRTLRDFAWLEPHLEIVNLSRGTTRDSERPALEKLRCALEKREPHIKQLAVLQEYIRVRVQAA